VSKSISLVCLLAASPALILAQSPKAATYITDEQVKAVNATPGIDRQLVMWALNAIAPSATARLVAAVPKAFVMTREHVRLVAEFIDSLFPMSPEGYNFDLYVSNADVNSYTLEAIRVPTLIIHTKDDQLASHQASKRAAERIPGARFVSLESGGHMMLGQEKNLAELATFLADSGGHLTKRVAS